MAASRRAGREELAAGERPCKICAATRPELAWPARLYRTKRAANDFGAHCRSACSCETHPVNIAEACTKCPELIQVKPSFFPAFWLSSTHCTVATQWSRFCKVIRLFTCRRWILFIFIFPALFCPHSFGASFEHTHTCTLPGAPAVSATANTIRYWLPAERDGSPLCTHRAPERRMYSDIHALNQ